MLIKDVPAPLHRKLKEAASQHRRSMTREALVILEEALGRGAAASFPPPYQGAIPLTKHLAGKAKRLGRE